MLAAAVAMVVVCHIECRLNRTETAEPTVVEQPQRATKFTYTDEQITAIDTLIGKLCQNGNFSGAVLVGQKDSILYGRC